MKKAILILLLMVGLNGEELDINQLKALGSKGDIYALTRLGMIYENGEDVKVNLDLAKRYYSQAAELGGEDAKIALALLLLDESIENSVSLKNNIVIKGDNNLRIELSIKDLKEIILKAKKMDKDALFTLATIYENGLGEIKPDINRAVALYKKSAQLGSLKSQKVLSIKGVVY